MDELKREFFKDYKKQFPGMNLEMISVFGLMMTALHQLPILMESYYQKMGLTQSRFIVLVQLYRKRDEGLSIGEICNFHKVRSATMTGIIDTLEREGQIERASDPTDRRKVIVKITRIGRELMEKFLPKYQGHIKQMLSKLTHKERRNLLDLLQKLHRGISTVIDNDSLEMKGNK